MVSLPKALRIAFLGSVLSLPLFQTLPVMAMKNNGETPPDCPTEQHQVKPTQVQQVEVLQQQVNPVQVTVVTARDIATLSIERLEDILHDHTVEHLSDAALQAAIHRFGELTEEGQTIVLNLLEERPNSTFLNSLEAWNQLQSQQAQDSSDSEDEIIQRNPRQPSSIGRNEDEQIRSSEPGHWMLGYLKRAVTMPTKLCKDLFKRFLGNGKGPDPKGGFSKGSHSL